MESDHRVVAFCPATKEQELGHLFWFDQFWNSEYAKNWSGRFSEIISESPVGDILFSPYETYIKTLYELYKEELEDEKLKNNFDSTHDLLDFQIKNAQSLLRRLKKYGVSILSDSVGLGKTYTAIEVMKQYLDTAEGRKRVEVICPKSLKEQWRTELAIQKVFNLEPVTLQNMNDIAQKKKLDHIANVSLFVIDESHNLKNRARKRFKEIASWIRNNPKAHVLMLTATPISNQLGDITNQLLLGTGGETDSLIFTYTDKKTQQATRINFHQAIENLQRKIKKDLKMENKIDEKHIKEHINPILRAFVVRRTRQGIEKEYGGLTIEGKKCTFPKVHPEVKKYKYESQTTGLIIKRNKNKKTPYFHIDDIYHISLESIVDNTKSLIHPLSNMKKMKKDVRKDEILSKSPIYLMYQVILFLNFIPYKWRTYQKEFYGKTRDELRDMNLSSEESKKVFLQIGIYGILRTMFLKRIESSIVAFEKSLIIYERKLQIFEKGIKRGKIISIKNLDSLEEKLGGGDDDVDPEDMDVLDDEEILDENATEEFYECKILLEDIKKENLLISFLKENIHVLKDDNAKLDAFIDLVKEIHKKYPSKKVLIFSYYADTIDFLRKALFEEKSSFNKENTGFLSSKNRNEAESLACRFSPISKKYDLKENEKELKYLFSTDILSEGQNLQDCGIVINYDLHWSPVRMIQRNGRINRLGTPFSDVHVHNISPEDQLEEYLGLVHRLESKIRLIKSTIGTDTPVLDEDENPLEFTDSLSDVYSDDFQKRIKAMMDSEREADFLLAEDEYVSDLKYFNANKKIDQSYKKKIYDIPLGKWGIMPKANFRGKKSHPRPQVLAFNELFDKKGRPSGHIFVSANTKGDNMEFIQNLQALEWLRADTRENKKGKDYISFSKSGFKKAVSTKIAVAYTHQDQEESVLEPQQNTVLGIMYKSQFLESQINSVRNAFQTTNEFDRQEIRKFIRKIVQSTKKGTTDLNSMNALADFSEKLLKKDFSSVEIQETKQVLFYVRTNN